MEGVGSFFFDYRSRARLRAHFSRNALWQPGTSRSRSDRSVFFDESRARIGVRSAESNDKRSSIAYVERIFKF